MQRVLSPFSVDAAVLPEWSQPRQRFGQAADRRLPRGRSTSASTRPRFTFLPPLVPACPISE